MAKYKIKLRCIACGHTWSRIVDRINAPDPPCPKCRRAAKKKPATDYSDGRAPGIVGENSRNKAIDETAKIVMEDYGKTMGVTNLVDAGGVREGDVLAPKLDPARQAVADNMFSRKRGNMPMLGNGGPGGVAASMNGAAIARAAMAGAFSPQRTGGPDPVAGAHAAKMKPAVKIIAGDK